MGHSAWARQATASVQGELEGSHGLGERRGRPGRPRAVLLKRQDREGVEWRDG